MALEQPTYVVADTIRNVELRNYEGLCVAECELPGARDLRDASSIAFGRLFAYISGRNSKSSKIAMTTPVRQIPTENGWRVSFVVPRDVVESGIPLPADQSIRLIQVPAATYAVLRYRGVWNGDRFEAKVKELRKTLEDAGIQSVGEPIGAVYNPPITPPPLRRNEVMLRIAKSKSLVAD